MIEFDKEQPGKTNLDHVREMSAEEIGEFICKAREADYICEVCPACQFCIIEYITETGIDSDIPPDCKKYFARWLNQPYEGEAK